MNAQSSSSSSSLLLSGSPDDMLREILSIMMGLKTIYEAEQAAMQNRRLKDFTALQPQKTTLMQQFEIGLKAVRAKGDAIKSASPSLRESIVKLQSEIDILAEQSMQWSMRMVESVRRMQTRLIMAGRAAIEQDKQVYGRKGALNTLGTRVQSTAINQSF